jgi:nicotinic acid phosphoribosyltransferase
MAYAYWQSGKSECHAVFEAFIRRCPFRGGFTVLAGISELLKIIEAFKFTDNHISYIRTLLPHTAPDSFFNYLAGLDCNQVRIFSFAEGELVFPHEPLMVKHCTDNPRERPLPLETVIGILPLGPQTLLTFLTKVAAGSLRI